MKDFYNKDFEEYVQAHADQHRMFPSDKIWKNVHKSLHPRRKWYGAGLAVLLLMTGSAVTWVMTSYPLARKQDLTQLPNITPLTASSSEQDSGTREKNRRDLAEVISIERHHARAATPAGTDSPKTAARTGTAVNAESAVAGNRLGGHSTVPGASIFDLPTGEAAGNRSYAPLANVTVSQPVDVPAGTSSDQARTTNGEQARVIDLPARHASQNPVNTGIAHSETGGADSKQFTASAAASIGGTNGSANNGSPANGTSSAADASNAARKTEAPLLLLTAEDPFTIENITNSYKAPARKVSWQLFVTPSVSYRVLNSNQSFGAQAAPGSSPLGPVTYPFASLADVNNAVQHKPDFGLQVGALARYPLSRNIRLRAGVQFNMNKYDIKAYAHSGEIAQIELGGPASSTVSTWTQYRSQGSARLDWLKNIYYSASLPVGLEATVFRSNRKSSRTSIGVAGTMQPTWVIKDKTYLISTDYKNYAQVPWLNRKLNLNTGLETFINFGNGKTEWQIGPQVRYQLLSSYNKKYPVRENLFDFGLKVGVTLNK